MKKKIVPYILLCALMCASTSLEAALYRGRIVDEQGRGIGYATVYPKCDPAAGTATNLDGYFSFESNIADWEDLIVSFIGYEKRVVPLAFFEIEEPLQELQTMVLKEQPIALEETVIATKPSRQKNKRKKMAALLSQVYNRMNADFSHSPARYRVVSDVRMDSEGEAWGMEQMIARIVVLPEEGREGRDSIQIQAENCKRYFRQDLREKADTILAGNILDNFDKKKKDRMDYRKAAQAVDSGVVVHRSLWSAGNALYDLQKELNNMKNWSVSNESEGETVLTYKERHNFLGIFKMDFCRNFILDSETLSLRRFSEHAEFWVNIPFGVKLSGDQLQLLNLLNMSSDEIEKFRLRKAHALITLNTIYQWKNGHIYTLEKNLKTDAQIMGTKNMEIPIQVRATQRVTTLETEDIKPMQKNEMTHRVPREIVEIY